MKIHSVNLFHTPESWDELTAWINRHNAEDRPHLWTAAGMAWNLASKIQELPVTETENAQV